MPYGILFRIYFFPCIFLFLSLLERHDPYTVYVPQEASENRGSGWCAPECINGATYTLKSDMYSFGVVMLEILTGRMPFDRFVLIAILTKLYLILHIFYSLCSLFPFLLFSVLSRKKSSILYNGQCHSSMISMLLRKWLILHYVDSTLPSKFLSLLISLRFVCRLALS